MRPFLDDLALFDHINPMGGPHCTESMRDNKDRTPLANLCHIPLDDGFGFVIQGAGRLIKNEKCGDWRPRLWQSQSVAAVRQKANNRAPRRWCHTHRAIRE